MLRGVGIGVSPAGASVRGGKSGPARQVVGGRGWGLYTLPAPGGQGRAWPPHATPSPGHGARGRPRVLETTLSGIGGKKLHAQPPFPAVMKWARGARRFRVRLGGAPRPGRPCAPALATVPGRRSGRRVHFFVDTASSPG